MSLRPMKQYGLLSFWAVWVKFWSGVEVSVGGFYFSGARFLPRSVLLHSYSSFFSAASVSVNIRFQPNCQLLEMRPSGALAVGRPMKRKLQDHCSGVKAARRLLAVW